jgi:hypothetical protein
MSALNPFFSPPSINALNFDIPSLIIPYQYSSILIYSFNYQDIKSAKEKLTFSQKKSENSQGKMQRLPSESFSYL